jgi:hypothetical protein
MFSLLNHYYNNVSQMCNLCSVFHSLNVWHSYLTSSSVFCGYVCDCQFCSCGCPMCLCYTKFCSSIVSKKHLCMTWNQFDSKDKCNFMYPMYTLDMFYILNMHCFLWIYGTLNKLNEWMNEWTNKKILC